MNDEDSDPTRLSDDECRAFFLTLFPGGMQTQALLEVLAPEGWVTSPLRLAFHPPDEVVQEETERFTKNIEELTKNRPKPKNPPKRSKELDDMFARIQKEIEEKAAAPPESDVTECARLVTMCLWDVFSDNHEVIAPDGRIVDVGSFRGAAGFLAAIFHGDGKEHRTMEMAPGFSMCMDYMEFYMGTHVVAARTDLRPIYRLIFSRLKEAGCKWKYTFPQLHVVDLAPLKEKMDEEKREKSGVKEWESYDPSASFGEDEKKREREAELAKMRDDHQKAHEESLEDARCRPPPRTVEVFKEVNGRWPKGWPPWDGK